MKILILDVLAPAVLERVIADNVMYRPDLLQKNPQALLAALQSMDIDAVISGADLRHELLSQWSARRGAPSYVVRLAIGDDAAAPAAPPAGHGYVQLLAAGANAGAAHVAALELLETTAMREAHGRRQRGAAAPASGAGKRVVMLGAGLVNLISAQLLQAHGYAVQFVDAGPDPRANAKWTEYGCSRGGDDARMFTLSEMDNYNDRSISGTMNSQFRRDVVDSGWNVHWKNTLSADEQRWNEQFESIPVWLADRYNEDIFGFNRESRPLWDSWIARDPSLFQESLLREGILRLYSDPGQYAAAVQRQNRIGATLHVLAPDDIRRDHPALADAVDGGHLAGGVHAVGFTVNAHKFIDRLIARLEQGGARFDWGQRAQAILFDEAGRVKAIRGAGKIHQGDHYVISPGAYSDTLLEGTRSRGKIHGVLGAWLRLPNLEPELLHSLKLARKGHITEDANITVATDRDGKPLLIIGSGYGYTGADPRNIDEALLHQIYLGLVDTARHYFPKSYAAALAGGGLESSFKYCVRPWTATGLGIFESLPAQGGGNCVITGGHNTGGFAQAPSIAAAVLAKLEGREHAMHAAYDPDRSAAFLATTTAPRGQQAAATLAEID